MTKLVPVVEIDSSAVTADAPQPLPGRDTCIGWIVSCTAEHGLLVDYSENRGGPCPARTTLQLEAAVLQRAIERRQEALLLFEGGAADRPIVVGLVQPTPAAEVSPPTQQPLATVDGRRVQLEAADEIVLRCGEASITLRRNGRVVIRGAYVESRSRGTNRIKGGNVQIN